jgi:3-oxoacyl-[acyl-carrier-protein] synthase II
MRVAITGIGAVSGFGRGAETWWNNLVEGKRAMRPRPELPPIGPISFFEDLPLDTPERAAEMALMAIAEATAEFPGASGRFGVVVGTTLGGIGGWLRAVRLGEDPGPRWSYGGPAQRIAEVLAANGPVQTCSVACASGNVALGAALDLIRSHRADVVIAGGVEALHDFVVAGFATLKAADP